MLPSADALRVLGEAVPPGAPGIAGRPCVGKGLLMQGHPNPPAPQAYRMFHHSYRMFL
jgi:hypothetical protein